jgi:hypothetical protein
MEEHMKSKAICTGVILALAVGSAALTFSHPQDPDQDDVRGAFLTTRPKTAPKPASSSTARPSRRRPRSTSSGNGNSTTSSNTNSGTTGNSGTATSTTSAAQRIGLGLTLFMRDSTGLAVRVDPAREFHTGDRVRVLLETNLDGHLYIFSTTNGGDPVMIYPDAQLDEAGNYLQAHVPFEIPSSLATEERLRWFRFDANAGTERLYFVFTREPLAGVPIEDDLLKYCSEAKDRCPWRPTADQWAGWQKESTGKLQIAPTPKNGMAQTKVEREAVTRGIGLAKDDPEPTLVMMTASNGPRVLVTSLDLVHK